MRKSTKGALAGAAAVALLLGGFGTHAAWTGSNTIAGGNLPSGHLKLGTVDCGTWSLTSLSGTVTDLGASGLTGLFLVPGDVLKRTCSLSVSVAGTDVSAKLSVSAPTLEKSSPTDSDALVSQLFPSVKFSDSGASTDTLSTGDQSVDAVVQVAFPDATSTADSQDLTAVLDAITVTLQQV